MREREKKGSVLSRVSLLINRRRRHVATRAIHVSAPRELSSPAIRSILFYGDIPDQAGEHWSSAGHPFSLRFLPFQVGRTPIRRLFSSISSSFPYFSESSPTEWSESHSQMR